jgi:hypothetical protein
MEKRFEGGREDEQVEATAPEVGPYVERKYTASRAPVRRVVVMGKCTVAGWVGWLMFAVLGGSDWEVCCD